MAIGTSKHLDEEQIKIAIVEHLRSKGILAAAQSVDLDVRGDGLDQPFSVFADVSECEDAPKRRGRKAAKEG